MPLSWNEIKDRALKFSKEWAEESSEEAEAKTFLGCLFQRVWRSRKRVATFEQRKLRSWTAGTAILIYSGKGFC
jgi:hypothetical protein